MVIDMDETDRETLIRIDERVANISEDIADLRTYNTRITNLEIWKGRIVGAIGVLAFIITIIVALF
jgi:hypothetical protein